VAQRLSVNHAHELDGQVILEPGAPSVWFLYQGQPFDVAKIYSPDGKFRGYYVDALGPVTWSLPGPLLAPITDLFLDLWIWPNGRSIVLDQEELDAAADQGWVTEEQRVLATNTITCIADQTSVAAFPPAEVTDFTAEEALFGRLSRLAPV
jgi:predicted RNA-binding protein associated with RNAse of E/G family